MENYTQKIHIAKAILLSSEFSAKSSHDKNKIIQIMLEKGIKQSDINKILSSNSSLSIVSFNLGFQVMNNTISGSEASLVKLCQAKYDGGWGDHHLAKCTQNAAEFVASYDLFGLQEVNPKYRNELEQYIVKLGTKNNKDFKFVNASENLGIVIGYDFSVMGTSILLTKKDYTFGDKANGYRGMMAVYFPDRNVLMINLHSPHKIDLLNILNSNFAYIEQLFLQKFQDRNPRIIVTGDFNDYRGLLIEPSIKGQLKMLGKPLRLHIKSIKDVPTSCCTDSGYKFVGDYIFDTDENKSIYFGFPPGYVRERKLMSDHDPVVIIDNGIQ